MTETAQKQRKDYPLTSEALKTITKGAGDKIAAFKKAHGGDPNRAQASRLIRDAWDEYATTKFIDEMLEDVGDALGLSAFAD